MATLATMFLRNGWWGELVVKRKGEGGRYIAVGKQAGRLPCLLCNMIVAKYATARGKHGK